MDRSILATGLALGLGLAACGDTVIVGDLEEVASLKAIPNPDLDVLFVVDNSASMTDQQVALAANFPRMMDVLAQLDGGLPNLHVGVITSDMGTSGSASAVPAPAVGAIGAGGCTGHGDAGTLQHANAPGLTGAFIEDVSDHAGGRLRNYTGELRDVFAQIAVVGDTGCGFEQHLAAMRASLGNPANAGFLRPDANLAVIIIADEDDCSVRDPAFFGPGTPDDPLTSFRCTRQGVTCDSAMDELGPKSGCVPRTDPSQIDDVQPFVDALVALKGDPRKVMVAGIVGDPTPVAVERSPAGDLGPALVPSCRFAGPNGEELADPAVRLAAFLDAFPGRSQLTSICSADLSAPLSEIGDSAKKLVGDPCLDTARLADTSPALPGIQPACDVVDIRDSAPMAPRALPTCSAGATDCYELAFDPTACPATADHLRVRFRRTSVADDTWTSIRCQTQP
jgi:hypothetical protein